MKKNKKIKNERFISNMIKTFEAIDKYRCRKKQDENTQLKFKLHG